MPVPGITICHKGLARTNPDIPTPPAYTHKYSPACPADALTQDWDMDKENWDRFMDPFELTLTFTRNG